MLVDLRRMNRVLEINEESAYAVVEPGVNFFDLYEHLRAGGHPLMMPVTELAFGSMVDHVLESGCVLAPCGVEVVLADGSLVRTVMGGLPDNRSWHACGQIPAPAVDGLFLQSGFGIVTRMGVWLRPRPERYLSCNVSCRHDRDLEALIDTIRPFLLDGTITNHPVLSNLISNAARVAGRREWYAGDGVIPEAELERIADETGIGRWNLRFALHGRPGIVQAQLAALAAAFGGIPQSRFGYRVYDGDAPEQAIHADDRSQAGIPEADLDHAVRWGDGAASDYISVSLAARLNAGEVVAQYRLLRSGLERHGFDHHGTLILGARGVFHVCRLPFDGQDDAQVQAAYGAREEVLTQLATAGHRPAVSSERKDHVLQRLHRSIRDAVDPNGILTPAIGRSCPSSG